MAHFDIFTLFPGMFAGVFDDSILKRARGAGIMSVALHNIRDYATGRHRVTDDTPYGGGGGMVMKPEPIFRAVETVLAHEPGWAAAARRRPAWRSWRLSEPPGRAVATPAGNIPVILLTPQGRTFNQKVADELAGASAYRADLWTLRGRRRARPRGIWSPTRFRSAIS